MDFKFQPASAEDVEKIYLNCKAVLCACERKHPLLMHDELTALFAQIKNNLACYSVVKYMGEVVGNYCFRRSGDHMMIEHICIDSFYRCRGACTQILRRCISATELPIIAEVYAINTGAVSVLRTNGFVISEWIDDNKFMMVYKNDEGFSMGDMSQNQRISEFIKSSIKPSRRRQKKITP